LVAARAVAIVAVAASLVAVPPMSTTVGRILLACGWHAAITRINNSVQNRVKKFRSITLAFRGGIAPTQINYSGGYNSRTSQTLVIGVGL
jgi:hypothetical protein